MTTKFFRIISIFMLILMLVSTTGCKKKKTPPSTNEGDSKVAIEKNTLPMDYLNNLKPNGYKISYQINSEEGSKKETTNITFEAKGEVYALDVSGNNNSSMIYDLSGSSFIIYTKLDNETLWEKEETPYGDGLTIEYARQMVAQSFASFYSYLSYYDGIALGKVFTKGGTKTIAGYNCTEYKYNAVFGDSSIDYSLWINEESSICFALETTGGVGSNTKKVSFTCTEFKTSNTIVLPSADEIDNGDPDVDPPVIVDPLQLSTPVVVIDESGVATWSVSNGSPSGYEIEINGTSRSENITSVTLTEGDTIRVKAKGDNINYYDSYWSNLETYEKESVYDFTGLGLDSYYEEVLIGVEEKAAGTYNNGNIYKCTNGDMIFYRGNSWIDMFTKNDGYHCVTLVFNYQLDTETKKTTDYEWYNYKDNKKEYYQALATAATTLKLYSIESTSTFANYQAFIDSLGIELLEKYEYETMNIKAYELGMYREYSNTINKDFLNTKFLHETRTLNFLDSYSSLINSWAVTRTNTEENYSDYRIEIYFNEDFSYLDYCSLLAALKLKNLAPYEGYSFPIADFGFNMFEGSIPVYNFPYEEEGEDLCDEYKLAGGTIDTLVTPYKLTITYTYKTWYDGGTFATYVVKPTGLWRYVDDTEQLMISTDGIEQKYAIAPSRILTNFNMTYTLNKESDDENKEQGYFVDECSMQKIGNTLVYILKQEYSTNFTITTKIGNKYYYVSGYLDADGYYWDDVSECYSLYDECHDVYRFLGGYYFDQFNAVETNNKETIDDTECTLYTSIIDDVSYSYYVAPDGICLKIIEHSEYPNTKLVKTFDVHVTSFDEEALNAITSSNILNYIPE